MRFPSAAAAIVAALALSALPAGCGDAAGPDTSEVEAAAASVTSTEMLEWIGRLADDSMRGRDTPSPELDEAAATIAAFFQQLGLRPAFPNGYIQSFPVAGGTAPNVAGVLRGRDSDLRDEYVVIVAHLDHKGIATPVDGDSVLNGADDNASGTAAVLEMAEAFASLAQAPRRSVIFLAVGGEEDGLLGSRYFVAHPPVALSRIAAAVNFDMISRNAPDSIFVGGLTASTLGDWVTAAAADRPDLDLRLTNIVSGGSDHVAFWERGIPFLMFFNGLHADYHQVSDEVELVDADKASRVARLGFHAGFAAAESRSRPTWHPGWPAAALPAP